MCAYQVVRVNYYGRWVETPKCWVWQSQSSVTIPVALKLDCSYCDLVNTIIERGNLQCDKSEVSISYMINAAPSRGKVAPSIIKSDADLRIYLLDVASNGSRPILKIGSVGSSGEGSNVAPDAQPLEAEPRTDGPPTAASVATDCDDDFDFSTEDGGTSLGLERSPTKMDKVSEQVDDSDETEPGSNVGDDQFKGNVMGQCDGLTLETKDELQTLLKLADVVAHFLKGFVGGSGGGGGGEDEEGAAAAEGGGAGGGGGSG